MDHARKVQLSEDDSSINNIAAITHSNTVPVGHSVPILKQTLSRMDAEISQTLNSDLPDDLKAKQYLFILRHYRLYDDDAVPPKADPFTQLTSQISPEHTFKAMRLLRRIKPLLKFNEEFELVLDSVTIPGSNVAELAEYSVQTNAAKPTGWQEFADLLKRSGTTKDLILNHGLRQHMWPKSKRTVKRRHWEPY